MKIFFDTNVLIDFILERPQFYPAAAMIISLAVEGKVEIAVSSLSMVTANFIAVDRCKMGSPDIVRGKHYLKYQRNTVEIPQRCVPLQYENQRRHKHVQGACLIHPS